MLFLCESPKVCLYHRCSPKGLIFQHSEAVIKLHQQPGSGGHLLTGSGVWRGGLVELPRHSSALTPQPCGGSRAQGAQASRGWQVSHSLPAQPNQLATHLVTKLW